MCSLLAMKALLLKKKNINQIYAAVGLIAELVGPEIKYERLPLEKCQHYTYTKVGCHLSKHQERAV